MKSPTEHSEEIPMNRLQRFRGAFRAPVLRNALATLTLAVGLADMAAAQPATYLDPSGREWMRLDETFAFAGSAPFTRKPDSGLYRFTYPVCELADPTNCNDAVVMPDLTGGGS
jgi:hypothetical protein